MERKLSNSFQTKRLKVLISMILMLLVNLRKLENHHQIKIVFKGNSNLTKVTLIRADLINTLMIINQQQTL